MRNLIARQAQASSSSMRVSIFYGSECLSLVRVRLVAVSISENCIEGRFYLMSSMYSGSCLK